MSLAILGPPTSRRADAGNTPEWVACPALIVVSQCRCQASAVRTVCTRRRSLFPQGGPHERISLFRAEGFAADHRDGRRRRSAVHLLPNTHPGAAVRIPVAWPSTCRGGVPDLRPNGHDARCSVAAGSGADTALSRLSLKGG